MGFSYEQLGPVVFAVFTEEERNAIDNLPAYLVIFNTTTGRLNISMPGPMGMTWYEFPQRIAGEDPNVTSTGRLVVLNDSTAAVDVRRTLTVPVKTGTGTGDLSNYGDHTHADDVDYRAEIDTEGDETDATWRWSADGGVTWDVGGIPIQATGRIELQNGVYVAFTAGTYDLGDYWDFTAVGTDNQLYELGVDTTNKIVRVATTLEIANDPNFRIQKVLELGELMPYIVFDDDGIGDLSGIYYRRSVNKIVAIVEGAGLLGLSASGDWDGSDGLVLSSLPLTLGNAPLNLSQISTPPTHILATGRFYAKTVGALVLPHWMDALGTETNLITGGTPALSACTGTISDTQHGSRGAGLHPAIKLDDAAAPDNNTDLNANTTNHGLALQATAPAANVISYLGIGNGETVYSMKSRPVYDEVTITIPTPTDGDDFTIRTFKMAVTLFEVQSVIVGGTSVKFNLYHGNDRSAAGTTALTADVTENNKTTGTLTTGAVWADATLNAGDHLRCKVITNTGTATELSVTVRFSLT